MSTPNLKPFMKISPALFLIGLALVGPGCSRHSQEAVPAGNFRLMVEDMVKDGTFRVASLKVLSLQGGTLSVSSGTGRSACELLVPAGQKVAQGQVFFTASKATDSRTTNASILVGVHISVSGGVDGMFQASTYTSAGSTTYYPPKDTKLNAFCSLTARSGVYPLDTPVEIGRVDGKAMMLTVGKGPLGSNAMAGAGR